MAAMMNENVDIK